MKAEKGLLKMGMSDKRSHGHALLKQSDDFITWRIIKTLQCLICVIRLCSFPPNGPKICTASHFRRTVRRWKCDA